MEQETMKSNYGRSFTYATVCSGIEAMSVAVSGLGFRPVFFSEIEPVLNSLRCRALGNSWPVPVARALVSEIMRIETERGAK